MADGYLDAAANPAAKVAKPRRVPSTRRAIGDARLAEINDVAARTGDDPALDTLFLHTLVAVLLGEQPPPAERAALDKAITATYAAAGISNEPARWSRPAPLLRDLVATLEAGADPAAGTLAARLSPWATGSFRDLFDGPTTFRPRGHLVVWSTRQLADELRAPGMLLALDAIWREVDVPSHTRSDGLGARRLVVVDETWTLLKDDEGAKFLYRLAKAARKRRVGVAVVTQEPVGRQVVTTTGIEDRPVWVGWSGRCGGEGPGAVVVVEAEVEQAAQVEGGHPGVQPPVVGGGAAVAQLAAAAFRADEPGDGAFDHGPVPAVGGAEMLVGGPVLTGCSQQRVVFVMLRLRPSLAVVLRCRSGQSRQATPKTALRAVVIRRVMPFGQVTVPVVSSMVKSSRVNPPATAGRGGAGLMIAVWPCSVSAARAWPVP